MPNITHATPFAPEVEDALFAHLAEHPCAAPDALAAIAGCTVAAIHHWLALPETQADLRSIRSAARVLDDINHLHTTDQLIDTHVRIITLLTSDTFRDATPDVAATMLEPARRSACALNHLRADLAHGHLPTRRNCVQTSRDQAQTSRDRQGAGLPATANPTPTSTSNPTPSSPRTRKPKELQSLLADLRALTFAYRHHTTLKLPAPTRLPTQNTHATGSRPKGDRQRVPRHPRPYKPSTRTTPPTRRLLRASASRPTRTRRCGLSTPIPDEPASHTRHPRLQSAGRAHARRITAPHRTCALTTPDPNHPS